MMPETMPKRNPYAAAAHRYAGLGFSPLPLPTAEKWPPPAGFTGRDGLDVSGPDIQEWIDNAETCPPAKPKRDSGIQAYDYSAPNIGLRLPDNMIGVDVDAHGGKSGGVELAALEAELGPLPPTYRSTSRLDDPISGIRPYRIPAGVELSDFGQSIDTIQRHHRYIVAWPSVHPSGGTYRWIDPDGDLMPHGELPDPALIPDLPAAWIDQFRASAPRYGDEDTAVTELLRNLPDDGEPTGEVAGAVAKAVRELRSGNGSRHNLTNREVLHILGMAADGIDTGHRAALLQLRSAFVDAANDGKRDVTGEFTRMLVGGVNKVARKHVDTTLTGRDGKPIVQRKPNRPNSKKYFGAKVGLKAETLLRDCQNESYADNQGNPFGPLASGADHRVWAYVGGVWRPGEDVLRHRVRLLLGERFRPSHANVVVDMVESQPAHVGLDVDDRWINVRNGLLDWRTKTLHPHDPNVPTVTQLPVTWNPNADCPNIERFIRDIAPDDERDEYVLLISEIAGYCAYTREPLHKAIMLDGTGRNGKGVLMHVLTALLGKENTSSVPPQRFDTNRFAAAEIMGRLANLAGDVNPETFTETAMFKQLTGGDKINAERKFGQPFEFYSYATIIASFNSLPRSADTTEGFFSRWVLVKFPHTFKPADENGNPRPGCKIKNPFLVDKLVTADELSGFLNLAVDALADLLDRGDFTKTSTSKKAERRFRIHADPVRGFLAARVEPCTDGKVSRNDLYYNYTQWCEREGLKYLSATRFYERVREVHDEVLEIPCVERKVRGVRCYRGIRVLNPITDVDDLDPDGDGPVDDDAD